MPGCTTTVRSPNSAGEVFAYLSDFSYAAHWQPGVSESRQLTAGSPTRVGARFHLVLGSRSWRTDRVYEVADLAAGRSLVLRADTPTGAVTETLSVTPTRKGCLVRYSTHTEARGLRVLTAPVLRVALRRRGLRAGNELQRLLAL